MTIRQMIKGKVILITGGTGSFGNSVISRLLTLKPRRVVVFSRDEKKQFDMRNKYDSDILKFVIGDVRDRDSVNRVMKDGIDYVFHAAALKQVPSCEFFPDQAIKTNILGAENVINAVIEHEVKRLVILSTDKAVYPINAMGMSKALMEKVMIAASKNILDKKSGVSTLCGVRYGNVLYSRGSVIPYFINLMKQNKKFQITDFDMTRFLLPLSDAIDLILFALVSGDNGHMYVRKAPACTIETLAKALCEIFDYEKGYEEVGLRAGEKMHETLVSAEEMVRAVDVGKYYKIPPESQGLDYNKYFVDGKRQRRESISYTSENTRRLNVVQTKKMLLKLPEIQSELKGRKVDIPFEPKSPIYTVMD